MHFLHNNCTAVSVWNDNRAVFICRPETAVQLFCKQ